MSYGWLAAADRTLLEEVDGRLGAAARRAGDQLACRLGCTECCVGPFPVTALDAWRLQQGLAELGRRSPERAAAVRERARSEVAAMAPWFPGDAVGGTLAGHDAAAEDRFLERFAGYPCPALDPESGACALYDHRPLSCRSFGPPVRIGGEALPPCRLCFTEASAGEVERCRVDPDPHGFEDAVLHRLGAPADTLIAWALAAGEPPA